jgi:hypothetical protein
MSQEDMSIFWEVIISAILSKKVYMYMCPIPKYFRDTAISMQSTDTPCPHTRCKSIDVGGGIFENVLWRIDPLLSNNFVNSGRS